MTFIQAHIHNQLLHKGRNSNIYLFGDRAYPVPSILKVSTEEYFEENKSSQFKNEYDFLKEIEVEGVRKVLDIVVTSDNKEALVLEYIEGKTLKKAFAEVRPNIIQFLEISLQLANILQQLHQKGIIHKDINNNNLLIDENGKNVTLIDFGISTKTTLKTQYLGNPETLEGTFPYISPEQTGRMNRVVDYRTDFYSLGVTLYHLITGVLPFDYDEVLQIIHAHIAKVPKLPHAIRTEIPEMVSRIILKLMEKNAEDRYQSAYGLKQDLKKCLEAYVNQGSIITFDLGQEDYSERFQIPQKLYGRERETEILLQSFENISKGKKEMLLIGGSSGVGKSALISEIHKPITSKKGLFIEGKFDQFQRDVPYYGFIQAFNDFVNLKLSESVTNINYWKDLILEAVGGLGKLLTGLVPNLELIIGEQPEVSKLRGVDAQNRFNYVLRQFITAIAQEQHPLVLFIDDWQWADQASLDLLQNIMTQPKGRHILLIGAYRNNETPKNHPFSITIDEIKNDVEYDDNVSIQSFLLQNLTLEQVGKLVKETLKGDEEFVNPLANLVYEKTYGNAFFVRQFLIALYKEGLIYFNGELRKWEGNLEAIFQQGFTDNVVELMLKKVKKLPAQTIKILQLAACIGSRFDIETLSALSQRSSELSLEEDLLSAIDEGFLLPTSVYSFLNTGLEERQVSREIIYQFAHDHVQQAFYSLIEGTNKQHFHFQIGELLLKRAKGNTPELLQNHKAIVEDIFEIVKHLNIGKHFVIDRSDKDELAQLNFLAGKKARASAAYQAADGYLHHAINLLGENAFEDNYEMTLELHEAAIEAAYMTDNSTRYLELIAMVLSKVKTVADSIKVRNVQIQSYIKKNQPLEAVNLGEKILKDLGVKFPERPHKLQIVAAIVKTKMRLVGRSVASLLEHPQMQDKRLLAIMELMAPTGTVAYWSKPDLMPLIISQMVQLSVKYGNNNFMPFAYSGYGIILCGYLGEIEKGYEFGQLALELIKKYNYTAYRARTLMVFNQMILPWKEHLRKSLQPLKKASKVAIEDGDVEMASLISYFHVIHGFLVGSPIDALQTATQESLEWIQELKQERVANLAVMFKQVLTNLDTQTNIPERLDGIHYKESKMLEVFEQKNDHNAFCIHYLLSAQLAIYFRKYKLAIESIQKMEPYLEAAVSTPMIPLYRFYYSLAYLGSYSTLSKKEQKRALKQVAANQKKMKKWAKHAPMNFKHKYLLVEAERFRVLKKYDQARAYYDEAIDQALKNQYIQEAGLIQELTARFYETQGKRHLLRGYIEGAYISYYKWGANALCISLQKEFPSFFKKSPSFSVINHHNSVSITSSSGFYSFDVHTFVKASQAISQEVNLPDLLKKMMGIIVESAGAERGFFMIAKDTLLHIEVACNYNPTLGIPKDKNVKEGIMLVDSHLVENIDSPKQVLSDKIAYYVSRSRKSVMLDDALQDERFSSCVYLRLNKPKSIICTPILNQGKLLGVLYLENNQLTGVFNENRAGLLDLLGSQVAISLNNALLYENLEQKVEERTQEISLQKEEIEKQKEKIEYQNRLITKRLRDKEQFFSYVSHELRTPLTGVAGMSTLLLETPLNAEQKNYAEIVKNSADNIVYIVNDFLDNAKLEAGKFRLDKKAFSLSLLLRNLELLQPKAKEKGISLVVKADTNLPEHIVGDSVRVSQILTNLLNNAIKFTKEGEVRLEVSTMNFIENKWKLKFEISDTGVGVAKNKLERIFENYNQVMDEEGTHNKGTGLGLSIVKQLVGLMEGSIYVESQEGVGSTFSVELEFPSVEKTESTAEKKSDLSTGVTDNNWAGKKILILEDNKINQLYAERLLRKYHFDLSIANDIEEARQQLNDTKFDCLLADVHLPDGDGIEFVGEVQNTEGHLNQHIPVVVLTAGTSEEERKRAKDLTIYGYVTKPFNADILKSYLRRVFQEKQPGSDTSKESSLTAYYSTLSERLGGDEAAIRQILALFVQQIPSTLQKMKEAVNRANWEGLYAETHHIKSTIQLIGLNDLRTLILKLEGASLDLKNIEEIPDLMDRFEELAVLEVRQAEELMR